LKYVLICCSIHRFFIIFKLDILSVNIVICCLKLINSCRMFLIQSTFFTYSEVAICSASVVCILDPQHIGEFSISIMCPEVDFLSSRSPIKSESVYPIKFSFPLYLSLYLNIFNTLFQSDTVRDSDFPVILWLFYERRN